MPLLVSIVFGVIQWLSRVLGAKLALGAIMFTSIGGMMLALKLGITALINAVPYIGLPPAIIAVAVSVLPDNTRQCLELIISARFLIFVFETQWLFLKTYTTLLQSKFV